MSAAAVVPPHARPTVRLSSHSTIPRHSPAGCLVMEGGGPPPFKRATTAQTKASCTDKSTPRVAGGCACGSLTHVLHVLTGWLLEASWLPSPFTA